MNRDKIFRTANKLVIKFILRKCEKGKKVERAYLDRFIV